ncbi:MAG: hypothetical protein ACYTHM_15985 [Planctomycetota bacterium]
MRVPRVGIFGRIQTGTFLLCLAGLSLLGQGCLNVTIARARNGNPIDAKKVERIVKGKSDLGEVLSLLGAPQEVHAHPDGRVLIYRYQARNLFEFGFNAGSVTRFFDATQILSSILENIKFTWVRINSDEDRVVILIGRDGIVRGIAARDKTKDLPIF